MYTVRVKVYDGRKMSTSRWIARTLDDALKYAKGSNPFDVVMSVDIKARLRLSKEQLREVYNEKG
jgi:hypothetical protein